MPDYEVVFAVACSDCRRTPAFNLQEEARAANQVVTYPGRIPGGGQLFAGPLWRIHARRWTPIIKKELRLHPETRFVFELEFHTDCSWLEDKLTSPFRGTCLAASSSPAACRISSPSCASQAVSYPHRTAAPGLLRQAPRVQGGDHQQDRLL